MHESGLQFKLSCGHWNLWSIEISSWTPSQFQTCLEVEVSHVNKAKQSGEIFYKNLIQVHKRYPFVLLSDSVNSAIFDVNFPDELKLVDRNHLYKKSDCGNKKATVQIRVLPSLSRTYEKLLYEQFNFFCQAKISPHFGGFCSIYITQHPLSDRLFYSQNWFDKSDVVRTILNISKAF